MYEIRPKSLGEKIQYMKDHAIIAKFIGTWPNKKDIIRWIRQWWKPKGDVDLQLGSKVFCTTIFHSLEDKARAFDSDPYFYGANGLHMRYWTEMFNPNKEDFTYVPIWIRLYSLPHEFWNEEVFSGIGNTLGSYIKTTKITQQKRYTTFARICIYLDVLGAIPKSIALTYEDSEWLQTLDYEFIPFRCRKFHEHGHLYRDCPLAQTSKPPTTKAQPDFEGFNHVPKARKPIPKKQGKENLV